MPPSFGLLWEVLDDLWDRLVDPADALYGPDGTRWLALGGVGAGGSAAALPFATEAELRAIRNQCRALATHNEFAINGHENRISYLVGAGHTYRVIPRPGREGPACQRLADQTQAVLDEFLRVNGWRKRQQEIVRRMDRDGEAFLRFFLGADGIVRVRFVEPDQVATPPERAGDPGASFGIQTDPEDVETVLGYWIDGRLVPGDEVQHRKANVDANVKRGLPLFYPVLKNLRRAEKLLRNMSVVAEIQSAIALIRKHAGASRGGVQQFVQSQADAVVAGPATGRSTLLRRYAPGTILDALAGTEYEFPAAGIDAARYVAVLQAELRAIASRLVMPEFMLTSDASNANYASTLVAEGPAVRMFQRLQQDLIDDDLEVLWRAVRGAVEGGRLPPEALEDLALDAQAPSLAVRDRLREAQADRILVACGAMSAETMAARHGLDLRRQRGEIGVARKGD